MDMEAILIKVLNNVLNGILNNPLIPYLLVGIFILISLTLLLKLTARSIKDFFRPRYKPFTNFKYQPRGTFFSNAEHLFFTILRKSLSDQYEIFPKVRIADVLEPEGGLSLKNWNTSFFKNIISTF
ncbi:MAG: DUF2726 domain-containing protein [Nitrosomonas sp.]|nr:DUF2726 domain-containing protein [Nitrosomonas sp.]